jgi:parallel beta-helix repeat protein
VIDQEERRAFVCRGEPETPPALVGLEPCCEEMRERKEKTRVNRGGRMNRRMRGTVSLSFAILAVCWSSACSDTNGAGGDAGSVDGTVSGSGGGAGAGNTSGQGGGAGQETGGTGGGTGEPLDSGSAGMDSGGSGRGGTAGPGTDGSTSGSGEAGDSGGGTDDAGVPDALCELPVQLYDVSSPTSVVGEGTPESCTAERLQQAADNGGTIVFDCGSTPTTIVVSSQIVFTGETVLDGGGLVTLSGGGSSRILYLDSGYDQTTPRLVVQRLTFRDGNSPAGGDDTAVGGGAIYRDGGSLTVIDCAFLDNRAPSPGQDIAGGAIYAFGGGETVIVGSTFSGNQASNGGAVGSLNGDLVLLNSTFVDNAATGHDGNPGNGGCGGAIYQDGADELSTLCGVTIRDNRAGAIGGGYFRVSNDLSGTMTVERTAVDANQVTASDQGNAGGLYLQGLDLTVTSSTISRNRAFYNGGIWIHSRQASLTNVTIAENTAFGSNGGGIWLSNSPAGLLLNCTIAKNHSTAADQVAGAIFGAGLSLRNTVISGNTAMWVPGCDETHPDQGGNLQWPDGALCTDSITVLDPELGALGDNGGPTETMLPGASSPARLRGSDCPATDQRGEPRATPCTAGAVEIP